MHIAPPPHLPPDLHCRYVEAAARTGQVKEVERMTRESEHLDPPRIKAFLMEARLPDMRPLVSVYSV